MRCRYDQGTARPRYDDIPWLVMYTMRNRVSHGYDKVDLEIIWKTIHSDLPVLHVQVTEALTSVSGNLDHEGMGP